MQTSRALGAAMLTLLLAACSSAGGGSGFLSAAPEETETTARPVSNDPDTRVMQLAWNTARAEKCGFQLDQGKLRANYLAWEGELGATPEEVARYAAAYDQSSALFKARIKGEGSTEYCTSPVVADVRGAVNQYLAGDFSSRQIYRRPVVVVKEENQAATAYLKGLGSE